MWRNVRHNNDLYLDGVRRRRNFKVIGEQASIRKRQYLVQVGSVVAVGNRAQFFCTAQSGNTLIVWVRAGERF